MGLQAHHFNRTERVQVETKQNKQRRELIEKVGKFYFDSCRRIAQIVTRLKKKKDDK